MKHIACFVFCISLLSTAALAHEGGHGPKMTDTAKQGGVVSGVILAKDVPLGHHAKALYKSELVRNEDGTVRVYLYDSQMNPLDLGKFDASAKGTVSFKKNRKRTSAKFELKKEDGSFAGNAPKAGSKPFDIEVNLKEGSQELLTAFHNLD